MSRHPDNRRPVLYVEDQSIHALVMGALFELRPQLRLVVAATGAEALCLVTGLDPVMLLLELHLPDCHGRQLLPLLRLHSPEAAAVAVTTDDDFDITGSDFCELWPKPLDLRHVLARLDALTNAAPADTLRAHALPDSPAALAVAHGFEGMASLTHQHPRRST